MQRDTPLHTFWAIIVMTFLALLVTHWWEIPGDRAVWVFLVFMLLGLPIGEVSERLSKR